MSKVAIELASAEYGAPKVPNKTASQKATKKVATKKATKSK